MDSFQTSLPEIKFCHTFGKYLDNQSPIMFCFFQKWCFWRWWSEDFQWVLALISTSAVSRSKNGGMGTSSLKFSLGGIVLQDLFTAEMLLLENLRKVSQEMKLVCFSVVDRCYSQRLFRDALQSLTLTAAQEIGTILKDWISVLHCFESLRGMVRFPTSCFRRL